MDHNAVLIAEREAQFKEQLLAKLSELSAKVDAVLAYIEETGAGTSAKAAKYKNKQD